MTKAREKYERASEVIEGSVAAGSLLTAFNLVSEAKVLLRMEERSAAVAASHRASQICERRYGVDSARAAWTYAFEANALRLLTDYPRAQSLFEHAVRNYEKRYGADAPVLIYVLFGLADTLAERGEPARALEVSERALGILEKSKPEASHEIAQGRWMKGLFLQRVGRFPEARAAFERSLGAAGPNTPDAVAALTSIAATMVPEKNYAGARVAFDRAVEAARQAGAQEVVYVLLYKASAYPARKDYAEGSRLFEEALGVYERAHADASAVADVLAAAADFDEKHARYPEAREKYGRAIRMYDDADGPEKPRAAAMLIKVGDCLVNEKKYAESLEPLGRALRAAEKINGPDSPALLEPLRSLFIAYHRMNRYDDARALLLRSLKIVTDRGLGEELLATDTLDSLGSFLLLRGDYKGAQAVAARGLSIYEKHPNHKKLADEFELRNLMGIALTLDGQLVRARDSIEKTMSAAEKELGTQSPEFNMALVNMAALLAAQGDTDALSGYVERFRGYTRSLGEDEDEAAAPLLFHLAGTLSAQLGKKAEARELFKKANDLLEAAAGPDSLVFAQELSAQALLLAGAEDYEGAEALLTRAEGILKRSGEGTFELGLTLIIRGEIYRSRGKYREAHAAVEEGLGILKQRLGAGHAVSAGALSTLGWLDYLQGDVPRARDSFLAASGVMDHLMRDVLPSLSLAEQRILLEQQMPVVSSGLLTLYEGGGGFRSAYELIFRAKGRLVDSLRRQTALNRLDPAGPDGRRAERLRRVRADIAGWYYRINTTPADKWQQTNKKLTAEKEGLERELARAGRPGDLDDPLADGVAGFQRLLRPDEVFVDVYLYEHRGKDDKAEKRYAAVVTGPAGEPELVNLGPVERIDEATKAWRNRVLAEEDAEREWKALSSLLWVPLAGALPKGASRIWLSPDGALARLPWHLLLATDPKTKGLLLTQADSARELARLRQLRREPTSRQPARVFLAGDIDYDAGLPAGAARDAGKGFTRLRNTLKEIESIGAIGRTLSAEVSLLTGADADKRRVIEALQKVSYAHLATHGFFARDTDEVAAVLKVIVRESPGEARLPNVRNPLVESGIALAGANWRDPLATEAGGLLTAEELIGLDLSRCELVTLSACETGRGEEVTGQGVMGLRASMMAAGARSMLISLWKVPDEATVKFMEAFYENFWGKKMSKAAALLRAQEAVRTDPSGKYRAPVYWAAWVLAGEAW